MEETKPLTATQWLKSMILGVILSESTDKLISANQVNQIKKCGAQSVILTFPRLRPGDQDWQLLVLSTTLEGYFNYASYEKCAVVNIPRYLK